MSVVITAKKNAKTDSWFKKVKTSQTEKVAKEKK